MGRFPTCAALLRRSSSGAHKVISHFFRIAICPENLLPMRSKGHHLARTKCDSREIANEIESSIFSLL